MGDERHVKDISAETGARHFSPLEDGDRYSPSLIRCDISPIDLTFRLHLFLS